MYLYGASGHAKVIIDILTKQNIAVTTIFDDNKNIENVLGIPVLLPNKINNLQEDFILSIGNNKVREKLANSLPNLKYAIAIHPSSIIDDSVSLNKGTVVMAGTVINSSVEIGKHCIINTCSTIDHDCKIGDYVHVSPNATLCGNVNIGKGSQIGAGSVVIQGVTIGMNVIIGAGSVIINDIPDNSVVVGNPGKIIKEIKQ